MPHIGACKQKEKGLDTNNTCYWVSLLSWWLRNQTLLCHLQFNRKFLPNESPSNKWRLTTPCIFSVSYHAALSFINVQFFNKLWNWCKWYSSLCSVLRHHHCEFMNLVATGLSNQLIQSHFIKLKSETAPIILSKMQILGIFLTPVRVLICRISVLEMLPILFFSSFPLLPQHSPNSTRTFVCISFNVKCAHRQLISNISQVWQPLQDLGLSPLSGQNQHLVQKMKMLLVRLENKSLSCLQSQGSDLYLFPACTGPCTPVGRQKNPTTAKSNNMRFQNKIQRQMWKQTTRPVNYYNGCDPPLTYNCCRSIYNWCRTDIDLMWCRLNPYWNQWS